MGEAIAKLDGEQFLGLCGILLGLVGLLGGIGVAMTAVIYSHHRRTQLDEMEATLKLEMIQRGMTADDIRKVLESRLAGGKGKGWNDLLLGMPPFMAAPGVFGKKCES